MPERSVLIVAQRLPLPIRGGGDLRVGQTISALAGTCRLGVVALTASGQAAEPPPGVSLWQAPVPSDAEPTATVADGLGWLRSPDAHPSDRWWTAETQAVVEGALRELEPQIVILEHLWTRAALTSARSAGCAVVLNTQNVEARLHEELALLGHQDYPRALVTRLAQRTALIERASVEAVDQVWAVSEGDRQEFVARYPNIAPTKVVPNGVEIGPQVRRPDPDRPTLLFPASFGYPPNVDAALFLARDVLPLVTREVPDARCVLAGANPPSAIRQLAQPGNPISVTGPVEEMATQFAEATAVLVPISAGGGSRYKILEAFAAGVPVISSAKGIEGIDARPDVEYLEATTALEFAQALLRIWREPALAARLADQAYSLVASRYSRATVSREITAALAELEKYPKRQAGDRA